MARTDLRAMGELADRLGELASIPSRASKVAAASITELLAEQFDEGVDPYGNAWAPLRPRTLEKHGAPPLTDTGEMSTGTVARPTAGSGIGLSVPLPGAIHQTGARRGAWRMPARHILPQAGTLPVTWSEAIASALTQAFGGALRRA